MGAIFRRFEKYKDVLTQASLVVEIGTARQGDDNSTFGFRDDLVVRISADEGKGTRVDVRSKSRVGMSDLGQNAKRIARFIELLGN